MNNTIILLYIDPGTGAMLLTTILGLVTTLSFAVKKLFIKFRFWAGGGKSKAVDLSTEKIPIVIFSDHKRYWGMFKPVCDEFEKRKIECCYWTASSDDPALEEQYKYVRCTFIGEGNRAYVKLNAMNAFVCLTTTPGLDVYQWKRSKKTDWYVHAIHGIGDAASYRMFGLDAFDAVLMAGEHQVEELRRLDEIRGNPKKEMLVVGESHMDALMEKYKSSKKDDYSERTVLLAPSWGASSILVRYGDKIIENLIKTGYRIIIRPHPQSYTFDKKIIDELIKNYPGNDKLIWDNSNDNFDSLNKADIMISDFSAVIWDYIFVFDKPVIYTDVLFDSGPYDLAWIDDVRWEFKVLPFVGQCLKEDDIPRIGDLIDNVLTSDRLIEERHELKKKAWGYPGKSAEQIVEYIERKHHELKNSLEMT